MRILHTSDWHLGISFHHKSLLEEQKECIEQIIALADEEEIDVLLLAGDVFDSRVASSEAIALYSSAVTRLCQQRKKEMVVIAGNHDGAARLSSCSALLEKSGLYVTGKLPERIRPYRKEHVELFSLPYVSVETVKNRYADKNITSYQEAMAYLCEEIRGQWTEGDCHILMAHAFVTGAALSESDQAALLGGAQQIDAAVFQGFDYVALGHLHRPQQVAPHVYYSGSPYTYSFGEANQEKSVCIFDTKTKEVRRVALSPSRKLRVIHGTLQEILAEAEKKQTEDYVKLEITDQPAGMELLELLRQSYPNLLSIVGKSLLPDGGQSTLTVEEMETWSPKQILKKFCKETAGYELTQQQISWFCQALAEAQKGGDLQ